MLPTMLVRPTETAVEVSTQRNHTLPSAWQNVNVHMVGIAGSGMCGLAAFLLRRGARVSGSDSRPGAELVRLTELGATVKTDQTADSVPPEAEFLVRSAAVPEDHPEIVEARRRDIPVIKYAQMLGTLMSHCEGIAVSGTHGKSTSTAWLAFVLRQAGLDPNFVVGASVAQLGGGSGAGTGPHFVAEACEYDRSFLNLRPHRAAILNIEEDHLDCYPNLAAIRAAFTEFAEHLPPDGLLVVNGDDEGCRQIAASAHTRVQTFGLKCAANWEAKDLALTDGRYAFTVVHDGQPLGRIALGIAGRHNVANALAVIALAHDCGVAWESIAQRIPEFQGVRRRLEVRGTVNGVCVVDDYAHHPTEIRATLQAARDLFTPRRLWCIFQPHQHSRTRFLLADFAKSFSQADHVVVPDIYFVRDTQREREAVSAADLVERIRERGDTAEYIPAFDGIVDRVAAAVAAGDVVLTMGAGNIWKVADELLRRLRGNLPA
jgi:UDP-N-acetylmuramate--alanine ligase